MPVSDHGASTRLPVLPRSECSRVASTRPRSSSRGSMESPTRPVPRSRSGLRAVSPRLRGRFLSGGLTRSDG